MSFNATNKTGIAEPLPVTDFLQFIPTIGAGVVMGFEQILKLFPSAFKTEAQLVAQRTTTQGAISFGKSTPLGKKWYDILKPVSSGIATTVTKKATIPSSITSNLLSKTNVVTTGILGTTALLSLTSGGQNVVNTTGQGITDVTNLGKSINDLFTKNPILPIGLLILGGLIVVSVIKK